MEGTVFMGGEKWVNVVNCMVKDDNHHDCGEHFVVYKNIDLLYCAFETTIMLYSTFTSHIKKKMSTRTK